MDTDRYPPLIRDALSHIPASVPRSLVAPPLHRMSWAAGVVIPPPIMAGVIRNFLYFGIVFGVLFGLIAALMAAPFAPSFLHIENAMGPAVLVAGIGYGVLMALVFHVNARKHRVPQWTDLQGMREPPPAN